MAQYAFEKLLKGFIKVYCTSTDPKGDVITYLKSEGCRKPKETSVSDHQDRMEEMIRYCMYLEGARDNLSDDETKTIIFNSFPAQWQINYKRSQSALQQTSIKYVMIFMSQEKELSDAANKKSNRWQGNKDGGGGRGGRGDQSCGRG